MTYCVGLLLNEGMVLLSDTRTNAGLDNIATYRKMFHFEEPGERVISIVTAGSLSVTQTTIARLREAIEDSDSTEETSIMKAPTMLKVASIIGNTLCKVRCEIDEKLATMKQGASASMIVAAQRRGGAMRLFLIYPEGNFIEATEDTPFLQIGEHKYGKPILDRVVKPNLSVGMPLDLSIIEKDACRVTRKRRIEAGDESFRAMSDAWSRALRDGFTQITL
jgi:putative proteasome-type protease